MSLLALLTISDLGLSHGKTGRVSLSAKVFLSLRSPKVAFHRDAAFVSLHLNQSGFILVIDSIDLLDLFRSSLLGLLRVANYDL